MDGALTADEPILAIVAERQKIARAVALACLEGRIIKGDAMEPPPMPGPNRAERRAAARRRDR